MVSWILLEQTAFLLIFQQSDETDKEKLRHECHFITKGTV